MKMPFDVDEAVDKTIDLCIYFDRFYANPFSMHSASIGIEDNYYMLIFNGKFYVEYNLDDNTYSELICYFDSCDLDEDKILEIENKIRNFFFNILPVES